MTISSVQDSAASNATSAPGAAEAPIPRPAGIDALRHLPGDDGRPWVGHTFDFVLDARGMVQRQRERYGPSFRIRMFGYPTFIVGDPEMARAVLMDPGKDYSSRMGWHFAIGELFARGLMLRDFDEHRLHRRIMQVAFRSDAMRTYLEMMNPLIARGLDAWAGAGELRFYPAIKQLTLDLAAEVFLGTQLGDEATQLNRAFVDAVQASIAIVKRPVPPLSYWRGMRGRALLEEFFAARIAARREGSGSDMFTQFCQAKTESGERFSDRDIVDHMIFLLMAAHDTTTSSISTMMWYLAQFPEWQERVRQEVGAVGSALAYDDRDRLPQAEWVFREALRMQPPVPFIGRRSVREVPLGDVTLPANAALSVCSLVTHFLPELWSDPQRFDPERFSPERAEDKKRTHAYYPFGGGAHMCLGMHFAHLQVKAFVLQFLQRYRVSLASQRPVKMRSIPIPKPKNGLPLRLERIA